MKRKSRKMPILAKILFPETYEDVENALMRHMPFLKMPMLRELLAEKATFITMLAIGATNESDWDIKEEQEDQELIPMCIFLRKESLPASEQEEDEEARRCANYSYISKMVADYARAFGKPVKRLPYHK